MKFFYHARAGDECIFLDSDEYHYLFRVRRFRDKILAFRNLKDLNIYIYRYDRKEKFILDSITQGELAPKSYLNLAMAIVDSKDIYAILPYLNSLNVKVLYLFYADFSQRNRNLSIDKMEHIIHLSCMQCNRILPMKVQILNSTKETLDTLPELCYIDFDGSESIESSSNLETLATNGIMIGPEGGFSNAEREQILCNQTRFKLSTEHILTTHLSAIHIASACLC